MAWLDDLKERLPATYEEAATLGVAIGIGGAAVVLAATFPVLFMVGGAVLLAAACCAAATSGRKGRKDEVPSKQWDTPTTRAAGYFDYLEREEEQSSSRFQDMVSSQDQAYQGWDR